MFVFFICNTADCVLDISFFGEVLRIGTPGYLPNETDVLRARQKSVGITETRFTMGQLSYASVSIARYTFMFMLDDPL